jgi:hypothetical protein
MMSRSLTSKEIQSIKERLESLRLSYLEIYNELFDHYVTALEQVEPDKFEDKKALLDKEFCWSMVRDMEKQLLDAVSKQLKKAQLEAFKFRKMDFWKVSVVLSYAAFLILVYRYISPDVMFACSFLPALGILIAMLYHAGNNFSLSMDLKYHRPRKVILQAAGGRYVLIYNFGYAFFFITYTFLNIHGIALWPMLLLVVYSTILNLYALSLYSSIYLQNFKLIKS